MNIDIKIINVHIDIFNMNLYNETKRNRNCDLEINITILMKIRRDFGMEVSSIGMEFA